MTVDSRKSVMPTVQSPSRSAGHAVGGLSPPLTADDASTLMTSDRQWLKTAA